VSRFQWGMVADIEQPDVEHRTAILKNKAALDHLELTIPDEVIRFIAENVRSNVRELEGSIIRLLAYASLKHRHISIDLAREALRDKLRGDNENSDPIDYSISIPSIQSAVAKEWGVTTEGLRSKVRTKNLTIPRQVSMFLIRELLGTQLIEIGNAFGGRDHSTVIHSLEKVQRELTTNPTFRDRVHRLRQDLETVQH
jgi:chromosomal replication initiator protein